MTMAELANPADESLCQVLRGQKKSCNWKNILLEHKDLGSLSTEQPG